MKLSKKALLVSGIALVVLGVLIFVYLLPIVTKVRADLKAYETQVASRNDYKLFTTPLPTDVVHDICSKLNLKETNENCEPDAIVYAPDLFDEITTYFNNLPNQDKTYDAVQAYLGNYLVSCQKTTSDGHYACDYDLRGDRIYPIAFFFDENDVYFQIIANTGGS